MADHQGPKRASRAQREWKRFVGGFYIANSITGIVVAGPYPTHGEAATRAAGMEPPAMLVVEREDSTHAS